MRGIYARQAKNESEKQNKKQKTRFSLLNNYINIRSFNSRNSYADVQYIFEKSA